MSKRPDPIDRPESYSLTGVTTTPAERFNARVTVRHYAHDDTERHLFLQMLGLDGPDEDYAQLAHHERTHA